LPCKYVLGSGLLLDSAAAAWSELQPGLDLRLVPLDPQAGDADVGGVLDGLDLSGASAFVAADAGLLNFRRLELVQALQARGVPMPPLVCRGAIVDAGVPVGDNSWIGHGAIVRHGVRIGMNTLVGAGAILGAGSAIGASCWIDDGVIVGREARIGDHVTLGLGVVVGHGVEVGAMCVVDRPGRIEAAIAPRTFLHAGYTQPMVVLGA
jgi:carbonic anhydrase/acetyltransferase-like protein (isoleucine patch superfamily)